MLRLKWNELAEFAEFLEIWTMHSELLMQFIDVDTQMKIYKL